MELKEVLRFQGLSILVAQEKGSGLQGMLHTVGVSVGNIWEPNARNELGEVCLCNLTSGQLSSTLCSQLCE